jgi:hypothetical protein
MINALLMFILSFSTQDMKQPAVVLTDATRDNLHLKLVEGQAIPDEVLWYTLDCIARKIKLPELEKMEKVLEGYPYAESGDALIAACRSSLTVHRGNRSGLFVFEILWVNVGARELDMIVKLYEEDWRFRLLRGVAHYWTSGHFGRGKIALNDLEFAYIKYLNLYGWDEALCWIRLWEGNLARRTGDLKLARTIWESICLEGPDCQYKELAKKLLNDTQSQ